MSVLFYVTQRAIFLTSVNEIIQNNNLNHLGNQAKLYLYGHDSINYVDNRDILISTLKCIKKLVVSRLKACLPWILLGVDGWV